MRFRAKDGQTGKILEQSYNGECWKWLDEGMNIIIEKSTGIFDRFDNEVFEGDRVFIHYKDKSPPVKVKFGYYANDKLTASLRKPHLGFYVEEDDEDDCGYYLMINANSEIFNEEEAA